MQVFSRTDSTATIDIANGSLAANEALVSPGMDPAERHLGFSYQEIQDVVNSCHEQSVASPDLMDPSSPKPLCMASPTESLKPPPAPEVPKDVHPQQVYVALLPQPPSSKKGLLGDAPATEPARRRSGEDSAVTKSHHQRRLSSSSSGNSTPTRHQVTY